MEDNSQELWNISEIIPGKLYLSGMFPTRSDAILNTYGITRIVRLGNFPYTSLRPSLTINIEDDENEPIDAFFEKCYQYIDAAINSGERVLVHCMAGVSRSATIVAYYLMKKYGMDVEDALLYTRARRPIVRPNDGFIRCLQRKYLSLNKKNNV